MDSSTDRANNLVRRLRSGRPSSFRGEVALAGLVLVIYGAVFGSSLLALAGGGAPDLLRLAPDEEASGTPVAEVLSAQDRATPVPLAATATRPAATATKPVPSPTARPAQTPAPRPQQPQPQQPQPAQSPVASTGAPPSASVSGQHLVRPGDTLSLISVIYSVDIGALKLINGLSSDVIYAGQTLAVPRPFEASAIGVARLGGR
jgi:LysM repeat protein